MEFFVREFTEWYQFETAHVSIALPKGCPTSKATVERLCIGIIHELCKMQTVNWKWCQKKISKLVSNDNLYLSSDRVSTKSLSLVWATDSNSTDSMMMMILVILDSDSLFWWYCFNTIDAPTGKCNIQSIQLNSKTIYITKFIWVECLKWLFECAIYLECWNNENDFSRI